CEWFVWDLRRSGLIDRDQPDAIVGEFLTRNPRAAAPALADHLVYQGTITPFQAERILNGKTQGLVLGPYVLLDAIGSGSMGQVYKASSKNDQNLFAVKVLPRRSMWNVRLARRQVRSFANFSHPAVVPFVDVGTAGGLHYLAWPLAEGQTLEGVVQRTGKLPAALAAVYGVQVAQGLNAAHQNSLFHGLVKPSNVLVGSDNQARILDFGIGSLLVENEGESLVDTMSTANTLTSGLDCASPESIMEPTNRTPAGDQYSLGCVLYYCLTGRVPFPEGSAVEKMMAHQTKDPTPIRELAPEVPEGLVKVVMKLMAKVPEERYTGCDEVVEALEPFLGDLSAAPTTDPGSALRRPGGSSSGSRPGLPAPGSRPGLPAPGSHPGTRPAPSHPGRSSFGLPPAAPAARTPPPPQSYPGVKMNPMPTGRGAAPGSQPGVSRNAPPLPPPSRGGSVPSRASFQLPPVAAPVEDDVPMADAVPERASAPTRWVDDAPNESRGGTVGPLGLVVVAVLVMVAVYFGATFLMK
ncbi:protein kinase, partial [bacterium]|nr:protein kinase [bacterium]